MFVSENLAEIAGCDSPAQMVGLRDVDLPWRSQAELYRRADILAFDGTVVANHPQIVTFVEGPNQTRRTLETKTALRDSHNQIIGLIGSAIDVTEHHILKNPGYFDVTGKKFICTGSLSGLTFSKKQMMLLQYIVMGYSAADIAGLLNRSKRTIEGHIEHLKHKLQCTSKAEIIRWAVTSGVLHGIDWPKHKEG